MRHQNTAAPLGGAQLFLQRGIQDAFLRMAKHLKARPEPRAQFDEVAAGRAATPGWALVRAGRACLSAAAERSPATLDATREEVTRFFDILRVATLAGYERTDVAPVNAILELAREEGDAQSAITRYAMSRNPSDARAMCDEIRVVEEACVVVLSIESRLELPAPSNPIGAVR